MTYPQCGDCVNFQKAQKIDPDMGSTVIPRLCLLFKADGYLDGLTVYRYTDAPTVCENFTRRKRKGVEE